MIKLLLEPGVRRLLPLLAACIFATVTGARPPNVVFILADDLGARELGCDGNTFNETPHLDRLAREGRRFTQAYADAPVCSPTRAALFSGQWPARIGITDYLGPHQPEKYLRPELPTLIKSLRGAGYVTGLVGKWHLTGDYVAARGAPEKHGWDEVICSERTYIGQVKSKYFHPWGHLPGVKGEPGEHITDRFNAESDAFIRRHHDRPFFLYLAHQAPHTPLQAKPERVATFAAKPGAGTSRHNPALAAMLADIDDGVGRILATLRELGLEESTLVIFSSDNGGESRVTSNAPLRGGKSELYEGGIRVPLIVRYPGVVPAGSVTAAPVSTVDFYPTLLAFTGAKPPAAHVLDGSDLSALWREGRAPEPRTLYWHYPLAKPHFLGGRSCGALRDGDWKLLEFFDRPQVELYNLAADPGETRNLAGDEPARLADLQSKLRRWRSSLGVSEKP